MEGTSCLLKDTCLFKNSGLWNGEKGMSIEELHKLRMIVIGLIASVVLIIGTFVFLMYYPFETVVFHGNPPIRVTNPAPAPTPENPTPDPRVPLGGIVTMDINYTKFISNSALIVRTLMRKLPNGEIVVVDSSTVVASRPKGSGISHATFAVLPNPLAVGTDCYVVFSIYYTLYGVRPIMVQYSTGRFEIYEDATYCPPGQIKK